MSSRSHEDFRIQVLQILDALLIWAAFWLAWDLRELTRLVLGMAVGDEDLRESINWLFYIVVPFTPLTLERFGFYDRIRTKRFHRALGQVFKSLLIIGVVVAVFALLAKFTDARRLAIVLGFLSSGVLLLLRDRITCRYLKSQAIKESSKEQIIIAGSAAETHQLFDELDAETTEEWNVICHFDLESQPVDELYREIKTHSVQRVVFATKDIDFDKISRAVEACEIQGVEAWIAASFMRNQVARPVFDAIGNKPMLVLRSTPALSWELMCKEIFDRIAAVLIILGTLPFWLIAAVGIAIQSPGAPVLFSQKRAGRYGRPFRMWKFRTMVPDAEALLQQIKEEHGNEMDGPVFKLDRDPRVFSFGAWLRKLSIDELPQLLNVARGEMSLVGPRPLPLYEVEAFPDMAHRRRLSVKPGITCLWQVSGRNQITKFDDWVKLDLQYIDNWSLWLDAIILLKTIPAVLFRRGAK